MSDRLTHEKLQVMMMEALSWCQKQGADQAQISCEREDGLSVDVRHQSLESLSYESGLSFSIRVFKDHASGNSETAQGHMDGLLSACQKALHIAHHTEKDPDFGLADQALMAYDAPKIALSFPWKLSIQQMCEMGKTLEGCLLSAKEISEVETVSISTHHTEVFYANTHGFFGQYDKTHHGIYASALSGEGRAKQRDSAYTLRLDPSQLPDIKDLANLTIERTKSRLGASSLSTRKCPVIFSERVSGTLIRHFIAAISGHALYRGTSFLKDQLGKRVWSPNVQISEIPHQDGHLGARPFDAEGVLTVPRTLVQDGVLEGYLLGAYSARKLNLAHTGHAGGAHAMCVETTRRVDTLDALLQEMDTGLLVTELIGQGVNLVTGDYSRGAAGYWVEGGKIQRPIDEITIAGTLMEMMQSIVAIAQDGQNNGSIDVGSMLIEKMTIAGI